MTNEQKILVRVALEKAVAVAFAIHGVEGFKTTSLWNSHLRAELDRTGM